MKVFYLALCRESFTELWNKARWFVGHYFSTDTCTFYDVCNFCTFFVNFIKRYKMPSQRFKGKVVYTVFNLIKKFKSFLRSALRMPKKKKPWQKSQWSANNFTICQTQFNTEKKEHAANLQCIIHNVSHKVRKNIRHVRSKKMGCIFKRIQLPTGDHRWIKFRN